MPRVPSLPRHWHQHRDRDRLRPGTALGTARGSQHQPRPLTEGVPRSLLRDHPPGDRDRLWHRPGLPAPAPAPHRGVPGVFFATASGETGTGSGPPPGSSPDPRHRLRDRPRGRLPFPGTTTDRRYCPRDRPEIFGITPRFLRSTLAPPAGLLPNPRYLPGPGDPSGSASETPPDLRDAPPINSTARFHPRSPVLPPASPPDSRDRSGINAKSLVPPLTTAASPASPAGLPHHSRDRLGPPVLSHRIALRSSASPPDLRHQSEEVRCLSLHRPQCHLPILSAPRTRVPMISPGITPRPLLLPWDCPEAASRPRYTTDHWYHPRDHPQTGPPMLPPQ
ncbi:basic proline-rich protein-like [Ammospiza nelsoni]|uniref:basic proline-rich protein-like n=1 Tax=Ammospiza caudacuta TaxID=2857398 RepID=UPI00273944BA|nr:basic proline-rich protein-like [Ammospiza caudacuta]XP_059343730.1 basic proline-rich protein-like [Ammospiza nelsoni]